MRQTFSSKDDNNEPLEDYHIYRPKMIAKLRALNDGTVGAIVSSSLKKEDKVQMLIELKQSTERALFSDI